MRDEVVHPFKPSSQGNGQVVVLAANNVSVAVSAVPHASNPEYPGVARILSRATADVFVRTSNLATSPTPAAFGTDVACPAGVVCYIELDQDTRFLSIFSTGSGSVYVGIGSGGLSA